MTQVIILAAGKGTRMQSGMPKVMHCIAQKPMIGHVIDTAMELNPSTIITVLSEEMFEAEDYVGSRSEIVIQKEQLGTGDAVKSALPYLKEDDDRVIILYGDTPLLTSETINNVLEKVKDEVVVSVLGINVKRKNEYGRLIVDGQDYLEKIVEFKDASDDEKKVKLCNSGIVAVSSKLLPGFIEKIKNDNAKGEYYLTDIVQIARDTGYKCTYSIVDEAEAIGINNRNQLSEAENIFQNRMRKKKALRA